MPIAPVLCLGAQWRTSAVYWRVAAKNAQLRGVRSKNVTSPSVNFASQTGIYVLYADYKPVYVGQANGSLFARLQMHHRTDDLAGRWDTFTWLGMRRALGGDDPALSTNATEFSISRKQLLDHLEAAMIHSFEPPMNGQEGRFGEAVIRYRQVRDPRLGPTDRELMESIAIEGGLLPPGKKGNQDWVERCLTPPSSGRSKGRSAPFGPPLMSNVREHKCTSTCGTPLLNCS